MIQRLKTDEVAEEDAGPAQGAEGAATTVVERELGDRRAGRRRRARPAREVLHAGAGRPDRRLHLARQGHHDPPRGLPEREGAAAEPRALHAGRVGRRRGAELPRPDRRRLVGPAAPARGRRADVRRARREHRRYGGVVEDQLAKNWYTAEVGDVGSLRGAADRAAQHRGRLRRVPRHARSRRRAGLSLVRGIIAAESLRRSASNEGCVTDRWSGDRQTRATGASGRGCDRQQRPPCRGDDGWARAAYSAAADRRRFERPAGSRRLRTRDRVRHAAGTRGPRFEVDEDERLRRRGEPVPRRGRGRRRTRRSRSSVPIRATRTNTSSRSSNRAGAWYSTCSARMTNSLPARRSHAEQAELRGGTRRARGRSRAGTGRSRRCPARRCPRSRRA